MMRAAIAVLSLLLAWATTSASPANASGVETAETLRAYVLSGRPWSDVEVRNLSLSAEPPGGPPRRIAVEKGLPGRTVFSMRYENGAVVTATADIAAFENVVVSARSLWKDRPLEPEDVCLARMEIGHVPPGAVRDPETVVGKTLTRSIGPHLPIVDRYVAASTLVKRGRKVTLLVETGGMRIATSGETRENAYVHAVVRAVNSTSKKTVTGILVDENTVRVVY